MSPLVISCETRASVTPRSTSRYQLESCCFRAKTKMTHPMLSCIKPSLVHVGFLTLGLITICHKTLTYLLVYPAFRLLFGTLYPAYASYKAVKTKNVKEYVSIFEFPVSIISPDWNLLCSR